MSHKKEQNRTTGKMESRNLTDTEFKTLVIRLLDELRGRVDELSKNFNKR